MTIFRVSLHQEINSSFHDVGFGHSIKKLSRKRQRTFSNPRDCDRSEKAGIHGSWSSRLKSVDLGQQPRLVHCELEPDHIRSDR